MPYIVIINPLMPGGNKKVTHTFQVRVTHLLPPGIKGLKHFCLCIAKKTKFKLLPVIFPCNFIRNFLQKT